MSLDNEGWASIGENSAMPSANYSSAHSWVPAGLWPMGKCQLSQITRNRSSFQISA